LSEIASFLAEADQSPVWLRASAPCRQLNNCFSVIEMARPLAGRAGDQGQQVGVLVEEFRVIVEMRATSFDFMSGLMSGFR